MVPSDGIASTGVITTASQRSTYPYVKAKSVTELALQAKSVTKRFGSFVALSDVSFDLKKGEIHCLAGENGSGKSTLIKIISGAYSPEEGAEFIFEGKPAKPRVLPSEAKRLGVHVIWQDLALFPDLTVAENIVFDRYVERPFAPRSRAKAIADAKRTLDELDVRVDPQALLGSLTIAKRQLVAICRVLQADARIIVMDEPTASLTKRETDALLGIARRLADQGISIVFVSHRLAEVLDVCRRVTVLRDGELVGTFPTEGMTQKRLSALMTGSELEQSPRVGRASDNVVLELRSLSRRGEFEDVSFKLRKGEILGVTGLLGSGRTEIAHATFGMTTPDSGAILMGGRQVKFTSNRDAIDAGIAYVSEDRLNLGLDQAQSVAMNSAATVLPDLTSGRFYLSPRRVMDLCLHWIARLRTKVSNPNLPVSSLSGGNQQRIVLAKWLATKPKVLILDSPTVGVDVGAKIGIFEIVRSLADDGMAIILISDEASEVHAQSDRIILLRSGKVAGVINPREISEDQLEEIVNA